MFVLLTLATAHADEAAGVAAMDMAPCTAGFASFSQPMPGATGVPTDVSPAVIIEAEGCGAPGEWTLTLNTADDGAMVQTATMSAASGLAELLPDAPLLANTAYVLVVEPNDMSAGPTEIAFTTGGGTSDEDAPVPTLSDVSFQFNPVTPLLLVNTTVKLGDAAGRDVIVQLLDASKDPFVESSVVTEASSMGTVLGTSWASTRAKMSTPETWCAAARIRNLNGTWAESEVSCDDVEVLEQGGAACDSGGRAPAALGVGLALAALGARRRAKGVRLLPLPFSRFLWMKRAS